MVKIIERIISEIADIGLYIAVFCGICVIGVAVYNWPILWWVVIVVALGGFLKAY
jgi:hypothetical protein